MIAFSGIDCSGKSTQIDRVNKILSKRGLKIKIMWSRGGYTPLLEKGKSLFRRNKNSSEKDRELYRNEIHKSPLKRKVLLWFSILDMIIYYGIYFRYLEFIGNTIIADRYYWDSYIDFKIKYNEFDFEGWLIWKILDKTYLKPKHSIIYTIPVDESMRRSGLKNEPFPENKEQRKIRIDHYQDLINKNKWNYVIDSMDSIESILNETMRIIDNEDKPDVKKRRFL